MWAKCGKLKRLPGYRRICMVTTVVTTVNALKVRAVWLSWLPFTPAYEERRERGLTVYIWPALFRPTMVTKWRNRLNLHEVVGDHGSRDGNHRLDSGGFVRINTLN
jgi:hypothetical protein